MKFRREAVLPTLLLLLGAVPLHAAVPAATSQVMRSIALAEDQRDWSGGAGGSPGH
jgi:hypothetical protein